jgi:hypothetical protein
VSKYLEDIEARLEMGMRQFKASDVAYLLNYIRVYKSSAEKRQDRLEKALDVCKGRIEQLEKCSNREIDVKEIMKKLRGNE